MISSPSPYHDQLAGLGSMLPPKYSVVYLDKRRVVKKVTYCQSLFSSNFTVYEAAAILDNSVPEPS